MGSLTNLINNLGYAWPALLMGAAVPISVLLVLLFSKNRKEMTFKPVLYGFGTFFAVLVAVAVLLLVFSQIFLTSISVSSESDADVYIYVGGGLILFFFWLGSELLKLISFESLIKAKKDAFGGLTFGCGFVLAQNLLIFGLIYMGGMDLGQSLAFGLLMLISGVIYILISAVGHQFALEKQRYAGAAIALSYFLMYAVMLIFSSIYVTYTFIAAILVFNLVVAYFTLPLPFKKKKEDAV